MKKPDRFEQIVEAFVKKKPAQSYLDGPAMLRRDAAVLLRRQHAAYVKLLTDVAGSDAHAWAGGQVAMIGHAQGAWIKRTDALAALARYKKGTP